MARSITPPASTTRNIQCRRTRSTVAHMNRSARVPTTTGAPVVAVGNAVSLVSVTQNPRHESEPAVTSGRYKQAAGDAAPGPGRLPGEPHSAVSDGDRRAYGRDLPSVVTNCDRGVCPGDGRGAGRGRAIVGAGPYHRPMSGSAPGPAGGAGEAAGEPAGATTRETTWETLRRRSRVYPPEPPGRAGVCAVCRGPAGPGYARCYQCARHQALGPSLLADAVVPISYAVKGAAFAADLWRYKAGGAPSAGTAAARTSLLALLLAFLRDHGGCVWRQAGMTAPGCLAVVPTGRGRPRPHPLLE